MLKILIGKQFTEVGNAFFRRKKKNKDGTYTYTRNKGTLVLLIIAAVLMAISMGGLASAFAVGLIPVGKIEAYFGFITILAVIFGIVGDVASTYSMLFKGADNELLMSMPIPPHYILISRMFPVYIMGILYTAIAYIPAVFVYWIFGALYGGLNLWTIIAPLLAFVLVTLVVLALSCFIGWIVALVAGKLKSKAITAVFVAVLLIGVYYVIYFRLNVWITSLMENPEGAERVLKTWLYPFYVLGGAAAGKPVQFGISLLISAGFAALTVFLMTKSFFRMALRKTGVKTKAYVAKKSRVKSADMALLGKEFRHFINSTPYMLNCGLGVIFLVGIGVFALIKGAVGRELLQSATESLPWISGVLTVGIISAVSLLTSMNAVSSPSVSLEGRTLWLLQSLPVDAWKVIRAKERLHLLVNVIPALFATIVLSVVAEVGVINTVIAAVSVVLFIWVDGDIGLAMNLKHPMFDWSNETIPIKQSSATVLSVFGGWAAIIVAAGVCVILSLFTGFAYSAILYPLVLIPVLLPVRNWMKKRGPELFKAY